MGYLFFGLTSLNLYGMHNDQLKQRKIEEQSLEILAIQRNSEVQPRISPRTASFLRTAGSAAIFTLSFAHVLSRIEANALGCDCMLVAELVGSCFIFPTGSNWGDMLDDKR